MKKLISFLFGLIFTVIAVVGVAGAGGYIYVRDTFGIDLIKTAQMMKKLTAPVDEATLCPNAYSADDMVDVKDMINASVEDFVTVNPDGGYNINFDDLSSAMQQEIALTDKQVGAIAQEVVEQEIEGKIDFGGDKVGVELKQVDFYDISENGTYFNVVVSVDMASLKKTTGNKIVDYAISLIPDKMYISSTVIVVHGTEAFTYDVKHAALQINALTAEETEELFHIFNVLFKVGEAEKWNVYVGQTIMNALIGNEENNGLAYGLKDVGAQDYHFVTKNNADYFVIECNVNVGTAGANP